MKKLIAILFALTSSMALNARVVGGAQIPAGQPPLMHQGHKVPSNAFNTTMGNEAGFSKINFTLPDGHKLRIVAACPQGVQGNILVATSQNGARFESTAVECGQSKNQRLQ